MKAFKCDGVIFCAECYLEILERTEYKELVKLNTKLVDVDNGYRCEDCKELCSNLVSLNAMKKIVKLWENNPPKEESICDTAPYPECNGAEGCDTCEHQVEE